MTRLPRTIIRIGRQSLAFAMPTQNPAESENDSAKKTAMRSFLQLEPYTVKSGMSMAANIREAFRTSPVLSHPNTRALVLIDSPVLLIPLEEFDESQKDELYHHTYPDCEHDTVENYVMHDLNCVALFSINKDVRMVITDHFDDVRLMPMTAPVWQHMHQRNYTGQARKLYAYFNEGQLHVFSFGKNRFRFENTFTTKEVADSTYFILYVWQQLALDQKKDELYIIGETSDPENLRAELKRYVQNVFPVNPSAEFNRAAVTQIPHITYDLICLCE